jgi:tetratricopeptide (TPR) repeat protein
VLALLLTAACGNVPPQGAPDAAATGNAASTARRILLITLDTTRADRIGAYGDPLARTPNLDALAARGVLFRDAWAVAPTTLPSHSSMLTGRWPKGHGARDNTAFTLDTAVPTLPAALRDAGFATGAFVSSVVLAPRTGISRGFGTYDAPADGARAAADTVPRALEWWRAQEGPAFLWVHLYDAHLPWTAPVGPDGDPYRAEVAAMDAALGPLLAEAEDAWVLVTADHGESLWEGGERDHGILVHAASTRVPMLLRPPVSIPVSDAGPAPPRITPALSVKRPPDLDAALRLDPVPDAPQAARVVEGAVSGADVAPTLATLAGVPLPGADGRSLQNALSGTLDASADWTAYTETFHPTFAYGWAARCALRSGSGPTARAFEGIAPQAPPEARTRGCGDVLDTPAADPRLEALGYTSGAGVLPEGDLAAVEELLRAESETDPERARARYATLVAAFPTLWRARTGLALALARTGDLVGALAQLDTPGLPDSMARQRERGTLLLALGRLEEALATAAHMQALAPGDPDGWRLETTVRMRTGDARGVERAAQNGLVVAPEDPALLYALGLSLSTRRADDAALDALLRARAAGSSAKDIDLQIGLLHDRAGRIDLGAAAYAAHRNGDPTDLRGWAAAAWMLARAGRCTEAAPLAAEALRLRPSDPGMRRVQTQCGSTTPH